MKQLTEEQKAARRASVRKFVQNNPGFTAAKKNRYRKRHPAKTRAKRLEKRYGLTVNQHEALVKFQLESCAICGRHKTSNILGLHVDHCHESGVIRGLLCPSCNQALGLLQDSPELCTKAASYLINKGQNIKHIVNPDPKNDHE